MKFKPALVADASVLGILGVSMLPPLLLSYWYHESMHRHFLIPFMILMCFAFLALVFRHRNHVMSARESIFMVVLLWISASAFGALPFMISQRIVGFSSAFFESLSGFTATGSTVLTDIEALPKSLLFWRSETHWLGGMGIVVLAIAILPVFRGQRNLLNAESPTSIGEEQIFRRVAKTAKSFWKVYLALTLAEFIALLPVMNWFDALTHTFSTIAGGGFSTRNASIAAFDSLYAEIIIMIFMVAGATSFVLHYQFLHGKFRYFRNQSFVSFIIVIFTGIVLISWNRLNMNPELESFKVLRESAFQVISIITTTGFATADFKFWPEFSIMTLLLLMFIGGMPASTSGAIKITRFQLLFKEFRHTINKMIHPHSVSLIMINGRELGAQTIIRLQLFVLSYLVIFVISGELMVFLGNPPGTAFSAVAATLGNVGPGIGLVGPFDNYSTFSTVSQWVLSVDMLLGRLEIWSFLALLMPEFWLS